MKEIEIPRSFLDMPRWRGGGREWLAGLPAATRERCAAWGLRVDGAVAHGSHAIAVPVSRDGAPFVLRMTPPGPDVSEQIAALRFWDGRGTVLLYEADAEGGAMLLERLDVSRSLRDVPVGEALPALGRMMRRQAVAGPPPGVPSTADLARERAASLAADWRRLGEPFDAAYLRAALDVAPGLSVAADDVAVNGDVHSAQVLRATREPWLTVDPVLLRGDVAFDLARALWTRLDEMPSAAAIAGHFDAAAREAEVDRDRARDWVVFRAVDYWLWGLDAGLTEDPPRCHRLAAALI